MTVLDTMIAKPPPLRADENGMLRVGRTRVTLDSLVAAYNNGCGADDIVRKYPTLDREDVYAIIAYYLWNKEELDRYLEENRRKTMLLRQEIEAKYPSDDFKKRILERHNHR